MPDRDRLASLNRLLHVVCSSLPAYLAGARPWSPLRRPELCAALENMARDQAAYAERLAAMVYQLGGRPDSGRFPTSFTDVHDLSAEYLVRRLIESQRIEVEAVRQCTAALAAGSPERNLAEEILGNLRGHLEILESAACPSRPA